jgi:hypothetical protein
MVGFECFAPLASLRVNFFGYFVHRTLPPKVNRKTARNVTMIIQFQSVFIVVSP